MYKAIVFDLDGTLIDTDVVIIDSNSSLVHVSTIPLLQLCSKVFYVLNLDFNNIRNNKHNLCNYIIYNNINYFNYISIIR